MTQDAIRDAISRISADEAGDRTYELVKIPSVTGDEGAAAAYYEELLSDIGLDTGLQHVEPGRPNVIGRLPGEGGGENLMLYGHLDTIPWTGCVEPRREAEVVWGRGASDMKGSLVAMALAAKALRESGVRLKGDFYLAASVGHEIPWPLHPTLGHGDGAKLIAHSIRQKEIPVDYCLIAEGPMDGVWVVQGALTPWRVTLTGGAGAVHTSTTTLNHSPVTWLGDMLAELYDYNDKIQQRASNPLIGKPPRLEIGMVTGGDYFNRNPTEATITGAIRWDPGWTDHWAEAEFRHWLVAARDRLVEKYRDESIEVDLFFRTGKEACDTRENSKTMELVEHLRAVAQPLLGIELDPVGLRAATDLEIFHRQAGIATAAFGPGLMPDAVPSGVKPGGAHSNDEGVLVDSLVQLARVYAALAIQTCGVVE